jgi:integrase
MRRRLPGIYPTPYGWRAQVSVGGRYYTKRFPLDTPVAEMEAWRLRTRADQLVTQAEAPEPGTLAADVETYLATRKGMPTLQTRRRMLEAWAAALGPDRARTTVTAAEVSAALATFRRKDGQPYGPVSLNHFRTALGHFYQVIDPAAPNPVRLVGRRREPEVAPRGVEPRLVRAILDAMPDCRTKAELLVLAYTGFPPAVIAALTPESLTRARSVVAPGRQKGAGTGEQRRALTDQGRQALAYFARMSAWGGVSSATRCIVFHRALAKVRAAHPKWIIPADLRPYDLRHGFGCAAYEATHDLHLVQGLMGHKDARTTRRYIQGVIPQGEAAAARKLTAYLTRAGVPPGRTSRRKPA